MRQYFTSFYVVSGQWSPCRLYTEQKSKRYTWIFRHLYESVKQMKVFLNVQRLCYAYSKRFMDVSRGNTWKSFKCDRGPIFRLHIWTEISHSLGLQKSTANQIRLNEMVVLDMWQPELWRHFPIGILGQVWFLIVSIPDLCPISYFDCLEKQP